MAAEDRPDRLRGARAGPRPCRGPSWKPGRRQSTQATRSPKQRRVSASPSAAVAKGDPRIGVEVVDMVGLDQAVHRGVDRRRRAAPAVQAVVERGDHLVLALDARVDVDERAQPVEPQDGEPGLGQRAEVAARALDPQQLDRRARHRIDARPLGRGVAAGVVRVPRVRPEPVRALEEPRRPAGSVVGVTASTLMRPSPPAARRPARPRSGPRSRTGRRPPSGSGSRPRPVRTSARSGRTSVL